MGPGRECVDHGPHGGDEALEVLGLHVDHGAHVGEVVLEAVAGDAGHDAGCYFVGRRQRTVVERRIVVGLIPDFRVDRPGEYQPNVHTRSDQVGIERFTPAHQGELRCAVGGFAGDAHPPPRLDTFTMVPERTIDQAGQEGQGDGYGREVVDPHHLLDLGHGEAEGRPTHGKPALLMTTSRGPISSQI